MKIGIIITPERKKDKIEKAFNEMNINYEFINLLEDNWNKALFQNFDGYMIFPPATSNKWRNIFLKRLLLANNILKGKTIPDLTSIMLYESKISMHDFYKYNELPHIPSRTYFNYKEAMDYSRNSSIPVIVKADTGSGALSVKVIKSRVQLKTIIFRAFFTNYSYMKLNKKFILKKIKAKLYPYKVFKDSNKQFLPLDEKNKGYIHIQDYIKIKHEWRLIRIGESYFGHKKIEDDNGFHSGSLNKEWGEVSQNLLDNFKEWTEKLQFESICFDVFEDGNGKYYINEVQVIFGTSTEHQLIVEGSGGRYIYKDRWVFQKGEFAKNGCNNLRLNTLLQKIK